MSCAVSRLAPRLILSAPQIKARRTNRYPFDLLQDVVERCGAYSDADGDGVDVRNGGESLGK